MTASMRSIPNRRSRFALDIALEVHRHGILKFFESIWHRYGDLSQTQIAS